MSEEQRLRGELEAAELELEDAAKKVRKVRHDLRDYFTEFTSMPHARSILINRLIYRCEKNKTLEDREEFSINHRHDGYSNFIAVMKLNNNSDGKLEFTFRVEKVIPF